MHSRAHAKINLGLHILGRREDGFHELRTIFHRVLLHDELSFRRTVRGVTLSVNRRYIPTDERNLCVRAANAFLAAADVDEGVHITLRKRIPVGAGLGGGSSDAACVLRKLPGLFGIELPEETIRGIALGLGSDVPFFLSEESAYATGRGERLEYFLLDLPYSILIVHPSVHVSTSWAYSQFTPDPGLPQFDLREFLQAHLADPRALAAGLRNDFEPLVFEHYPSVKFAKEQLVALGADVALMSGSGSAVFGLFAEEPAAVAALEALAKKFQVYLTPAGWKG